MDPTTSIPGILDALAHISLAYQDAEKRASQAKAELVTMLPTSPEGMTLQHARTVGLRQEKPLPLDEIVREMRLDG